MLTVFSAAICPFAQRTRALLAHLEVPHEVREVDLGDRDPELLRRSPTGRVPFLVDGGFELYESRTIADYLAERSGWREAYAEDPQVRALQRLAMSRWDDAVLPVAFYHALGGEDLDEARRESLRRELGWIARAVAETPPASLLGFHCAPFWARMTWLRAHTPLPDLIEADPALRGWLDEAVAVPAVRETLPDREWAVAEYERRYVQRS